MDSEAAVELADRMLETDTDSQQLSNDLLAPIVIAKDQTRHSRFYFLPPPPPPFYTIYSRVH